MTHDGAPVSLEELGLTLEPLKFMEFSLEGTTQAVLIGREGACIVNIPAPARYAIHKLIVYGERDASARVKAIKDIAQVASLVEWHLDNGQAAQINAAWRDALGRGKGWRARALEGLAALLARHPALDDKALWRQR
jgi:hypothetical protein